MKINASITIARDSRDTILVQIQDDASRATFVRLEFTPHDFMLALTGLSSVDAKSAEVVGLSVVGKRKITERRSIAYPGQSYGSREEMSVWLAENGKEEGWVVNPYLGSQSSISPNGGQTTLNYTVYRFEDIPADQESSNG